MVNLNCYDYCNNECITTQFFMHLCINSNANIKIYTMDESKYLIAVAAIRKAINRCLKTSSLMFLYIFAMSIYINIDLSLAIFFANVPKKTIHKAPTSTASTFCLSEEKNSLIK